MPIVKCKICSKDFYAKPSWILRGHGRYCSPPCQYLGRRNGKMVSCYICSKEVYKSKKSLDHSKSKKYFCSKSCQTRWRNTEFIGPKHANWVHGKYVYKSILRRNKVPEICVLCKVKDSRVLAVHHIDHNHSNNVLKNLCWLCHNCHFLVHHDSIEKQRFTVLIGKALYRK